MQNSSFIYIFFINTFSYNKTIIDLTYLTKRLNPEIGTRRLIGLLRAWSLEVKEMLGGAGINAVESLRGNREHLRGVSLTNRELDILGIKHAGEAW